MSGHPDRIGAIFEAAVVRDAADRSSFVLEACAGDAELRQQILSMLEAVDRPQLIDQPVGAAIAQLLDDEPPAVIGLQLGPYRVESLLGVGGMGEVYRATDTVLGRQVAIKVLPAGLAADVERIARFRREARVLASLNHPNIGAIYGVEPLQGQPDPTFGLVLELVEGPTLADALASGPLPLDHAVMLARQIAEALDAAHEQGIVHRDLKPGNIKVREDGTLKVLDFGLATVAASSAGEDSARTRLSDSPTMAAPAMTGAGIILGTAAYMAPEQARGKRIDKRADIWAFGAVLYEMLAGKPVFSGDDVTDILAAIVKDEPDWSAVPERTRPLLQRCLQKDPRRRLRDIGDAVPLLEETVAPPRVAPARTARLTWAAAALGAVAIALAGVAIALWGRPAGEQPPVRLAIPLPEGWRVERIGVATVTGATSSLVVSPDGRYVAMVARAANEVPAVLLHDLRTGDTQQLPGMGGAASLFWSPDSRFLGFAAGGWLKRVAVTGGPAVTICEAPGRTFGATWSRDDTIVFATFQQGATRLNQVSAFGGAVRDAVPVAAGGQSDVPSMPSFLPDGRHLLYLAVPITALADDTPRALYVQALGSPDRVKLGEVSVGHMQYADGHVLYVQEGTLMAHPFDPERHALAGEAIPVADSTDRFAFSASQNGVLVYQAGSAAVGSQLAWVDRLGKSVATIGEPANYREFSLSPNEGHALAVIGNALWMIDLARGVPTRFSTSPAVYNNPVWSPAGDAVAYAAATGRFSDLFIRPASGIDAEERILSSDDSARVPTSWSRTGLLVFIVGTGPFSNNDVWVMPVHGDRRPSPLFATGANETRAKVSPDGRWVAFMSNDSRRDEVYVAPFPDPASGAGRVRVSTSGGTLPRWRGDGRELFYLDAATSTLMAASVEGRGAAFTVAGVKPLFTLAGVDPIYAAPYDVAASGQRFLVTLRPGRLATPLPTVALNWQPR